jgi:hypothetical protein
VVVVTNAEITPKVVAVATAIETVLTVVVAVAVIEAVLPTTAAVISNVPVVAATNLKPDNEFQRSQII